MALIKDGQATPNDPWIRVEGDADIPSEGDVIVELARWRDHASELRTRSGRCGVALRPEDDVFELEGQLDGVALVAIVFPKFTDGRGYSSARLLRDRLGFRGELRAVGHVLPDQLFYMKRVGFDAFELADGKSVDTAVQQLESFSVTYQGAADDARPLFRRIDRPSS